jgi:hypothetical protein
MFFVPGIVITILTFPGVIVHELAHQLFCRWFKVPVFEVVYFQPKNPAGYVLHEVPQHKWQTILISVGPFFINTLAAPLLLCRPYCRYSVLIVVILPITCSFTSGYRLPCMHFRVEVMRKVLLT